MPPTSPVTALGAVPGRAGEQLTPDGRRGTARVGCSGWIYRDWRGVVYPADLPQKQWFAHYASLFDTVEINNTFYRLPTAEAVDHWAAQAPPGFVYALKLGQFGSHRKKLKDAAEWLPRHVERAQRLGAALGPTVVQLPPRWRRNVERLDEFLSVAPTTMRWAVELRDASWLHDDVFDTLRRHGAALCVHDLLADHPYVLTTDWTYVRFHGPDALRHPTTAATAEAARAVGRPPGGELAAGRDVYCSSTTTTGATPSTDAWSCAACIEQLNSELDVWRRPISAVSDIQFEVSGRIARGPPVHAPTYTGRTRSAGYCRRPPGSRGGLDTCLSRSTGGCRTTWKPSSTARCDRRRASASGRWHRCAGPAGGPRRGSSSSAR